MPKLNIGITFKGFGRKHKKKYNDVPSIREMLELDDSPPSSPVSESSNPYKPSAVPASHSYTPYLYRDTHGNTLEDLGASTCPFGIGSTTIDVRLIMHNKTAEIILVRDLTCDNSTKEKYENDQFRNTFELDTTIPYPDNVDLVSITKRVTLPYTIDWSCIQYHRSSFIGIAIIHDLSDIHAYWNEGRESYSTLCHIMSIQLKNGPDYTYKLYNDILHEVYGDMRAAYKSISDLVVSDGPCYTRSNCTITIHDNWDRWDYESLGPVKVYSHAILDFFTHERMTRKYLEKLMYKEICSHMYD